MNLEIERKFLLNPHYSFLDVIKNQKRSVKEITQAYIMSNEDANLRVRKENDSYTMCLKQSTMNDMIKREFEFPIPEEQGEELINSTETKFNKVRHSFQLQEGITCDLDVFKDHSIVWIEFEFASKSLAKKFELPEWVGKEITGSKIFNNIAIAKDEL